MRSAIGIDIGGTKIRAGRVSESGALDAELVEPTAKSADAVIAQIDAAIDKLDDGSIKSIGIGVPGRVDANAGLVLSGGFVDLSGPPLATRLRNEHSHPIFVDNDANMALVAEAAIGAGKGLSSIVMLTIGTGIGGSIMDRGQILRGRATAGQLGHITAETDGVLCLCGRRGCLETASSGTALARLLSISGLAHNTSALTLLQRDDADARGIVNAWAGPLRTGIDSLVAVLDPECVILGGGLGQPAWEALCRFPAHASWYQCDVRAAMLGDRAGVIGSGLAALEFAQ